MSRELALTMISVDRTPSRNFLSETVANLRRGGVAESVLIADSGSTFEFYNRALRQDNGIGFWATIDTEFDNRSGPSETFWHVHMPLAKRSPNRNVAVALHLGEATGKPWVLFMEDDIDVCANFVPSIEQWLADYADERYRVYPLGANYFFPNRGACEYPIRMFYGTQAFVIRREDALSLAQWLETHEFDLNDTGSAYDIHMHQWMKATYPQHSSFLAAAPAFIQHIGKESIIAPRPAGEIHTFPSWKGREWSYSSRV